MTKASVVQFITVYKRSIEPGSTEITVPLCYLIWKTISECGVKNTLYPVEES